MTARQSFFEATKLKNIWNRDIEWNGHHLATVMFHADREWKIVQPGTTWEQYADRNFKPVAEFHTQQELWEYIKTA